MRKTKTFLCMIMFLLAICVIPTAALATPMTTTLEEIYSDGVRLVRDNSTGDVWITDMEQFSNKKFWQVGKKIKQLNRNAYGGVNTWELATVDQVGALFTSIKSFEDAALFGLTYDSASGYDDDEYGSWGMTATRVEGTKYRYYAPYLARWPDRPDYWYEGGLTGNWSSKKYSGNPDIGAWVKTTGYPVPEPTTLLLLGSGMVALASFKRRFRKK